MGNKPNLAYSAEWQDISTAPKDGTPIQLSVQGRFIRECAWGYLNGPAYNNPDNTPLAWRICQPFLRMDEIKITGGIHRLKETYQESIDIGHGDPDPTHWRQIEYPCNLLNPEFYRHD